MKFKTGDPVWWIDGDMVIEGVVESVKPGNTPGFAMIKIDYEISGIPFREASPEYSVFHRPAQRKLCADILHNRASCMHLAATELEKGTDAVDAVSCLG